LAPSEKEEFGIAQYDAWQTAQRAHAIANGVFVCSVNRVGHEHGDVRLKKDNGDGTHTKVDLKGPEGAGIESGEAVLSPIPSAAFSHRHRMTKKRFC